MYSGFSIILPELVKIVKEVGTLLLEWRSSGGIRGEWVGGQFKARADVMAHEVLRERLEKLEPGIPIISEEDEVSWTQNRPETYWIIDPIDGTASYAEGFSGFVTQIALMEKKRPIVSVIYAPSLNQIYTAQRKGRPTLNGESLVLPVNRKEKERILIDNYSRPQGITRAAFRELGFTRYLECGSISLKICMIANGSADLFFKDVPIRDWDIAAPHLVLERAGGFLCEIHGEKFVYSNNYEHRGLVAAATGEDAGRFLSWYKQKSF